MNTNAASEPTSLPSNVLRDGREKRERERAIPAQCPFSWGRQCLSSSSPHAFFSPPLSNIDDDTMCPAATMSYLYEWHVRSQLSWGRRGEDGRFLLFVIWMGSLFWVEEEKKAEDSRVGGTTGSCQAPPPLIDWRQRSPQEYLHFSFVFCSFFSSLGCWEVLHLFICLLSPSSASSSISPFTWSTISSIYDPDKEGERGSEREREGGISPPFFNLPYFLHSSSLSLPIAFTTSPFSPRTAHAPPSLYPPLLPLLPATPVTLHP